MPNCVKAGTILFMSCKHGPSFGTPSLGAFENGEGTLVLKPNIRQFLKLKKPSKAHHLLEGPLL